MTSERPGGCAGPIAARFALALAAALLSFGAEAQQWGIQVRNAQGGAGAEVTAVTPGTPADVAEIRPGDVIVQAQGRAVANAFQFTQAAQGVPLDKALTITLSRQGWEREVRLTAPPMLLSFGLTVKDGGAGAGAEIASVAPNGAAATIGLQPGDLITAAEGRKIVSAAAISAVLQDYAAQSKPLTLTVTRENWAKEVTITPKPLGVAAAATSNAPDPAGARNTPTPSASAAQGASGPSPTARNNAPRDVPATVPAPMSANAPAAAPQVLMTDRADVIADLGNGNRAYDSQNWPDAEIYFKRVLTIVPDESRAWGRLCHAQVMQARFADAAGTCQRASQFSPADASILQNTGYSLFRLGKHADSIGWYQKAISVQPDWAQPYAGIGAAQFALSNWAKAEESYKLVVVRDPGNQSAWQSLGDVAAEQGKTADAIAHYRKALASGPANAELYRGLGWQLSKEGRLTDAETSLVEATRLNPRDTNALVSLGLVEDKLGKYAEARDAWQRAVDLDPNGKLGSIARENIAALATRPPQTRPATVGAATAPAKVETMPMRSETIPVARPTATAPDVPRDQPLPIDDPDVDAGK